jgi:hypothetical protein
VIEANPSGRPGPMAKPVVCWCKVLSYSASSLQLAIALQHTPTGIANSEAVGGQGGPAPKEIAPGHSLGAVAEPSSGGAAWSQIVHIESDSGRGR